MIPTMTLVRIALRTLFIQAGYSPQGMQTLGLLYALEPAWPYLFATPEAREEAVRRHLSSFNTHPYASAALVGGILHQETKLAQGKATVEEVVQFKQALMGPLAALGDGFFWLSLRPATGAVAVASVPWTGVWAPLLFLLTYNFVHLVTRVWLFLTAYRHGAKVVVRLSSFRIPQWSQRLRVVAAGAAGVCAVQCVMAAGAIGAGSWLGAGCLGLGAGAFLLAERKVPALLLLYVTAALAVVAGVLW